MSFEIIPLKCQSCGSGSLDFRTWRVAKCANCGTVHIIDGKEDITKALQAIGATSNDISIRIPLKIAVGLYLREQGLLLSEYETRDYFTEENFKVFSENPISAEGSLFLYTRKINERKIYDGQTWWGGTKMIPCTEINPEYFCEIDFGEGNSIDMRVWGRGAMPECERIIKKVWQGMHLHVNATLIVS